MFMPTLLVAQTLTNKERRLINSHVLALVEEYERYASLYDDEAEYFFGTLFSDDARVVSDMIGSPMYLQSILSTQYVSSITENATNVFTVVKDVKKGRMRFEGDKWHIPVSFKKGFSYIDNNGYVFSIADYYDTDFTIDMDIVYEPEEQRCYIASIDGSVDSKKEFPKGRFDIVDRGVYTSNRERRYLETIRIDNKPLEFDANGHAYVNQGFATVDDADVIVKRNTLSSGYNYDIVKYSFAIRTLRLKPRFSYAPFMAYKVTTENTGLTTNSDAMEAGLDFGFTFPAGRKCKMGIFFGAGYSMSNFALSYDSEKNGPISEYSYTLLIPNSNYLVFDAKTYRYTINSASESIKYKDVYVPLYLDFEFMLGKHLLMSFNFGAKAYVNLSATVAKPFMVKFNDGEPYAPSYFVAPNTYKKNPFDVSAIANLELDINLFDRRIYLMVGAGYEHGFLKSYKSNTMTFVGSGKPVLPSLDGHIATVSLIGGLEMYRQAIWFTTGFKFKL